MQRADVFLDTIGFSGFNTALQAIQCGLPVVTLQGRFLRGRLASGILRRIGLDELVAQDEDGYVALAARLARDAAYRGAGAASHRGQPQPAVRGRRPVRALEEFLLARVR